MEFYSFLRQFADSWVLLAMTLFYVGVIVWVFRPGTRKTYDDISQIPLRNETLPDDSDVQGTKSGNSFKMEAQP